MTSTPTFFSMRYAIACVICSRSPLMMATVPPIGAFYTMAISEKIILSTISNLRDTVEMSGSETLR